ncbi:MAG: ABC transporter ATP-binding protein [Chlorobi bacterium]|nr:ABC transporter ATP-binding protein [Chlorobiota bacterium]
MKKFIKVLRFLMPYKVLVAFNIFFTLLSVLFSLFSLTMAIPILGILFKTQPVIETLPAFQFSTDVLMAIFNYYVSAIILKFGAAWALGLICMLFITLTFLKTFFAYLSMYVLCPIRDGIVRDVRNMIYFKIILLPLAYFSEERKGDILARITSDVQEVEWSILSSFQVISRVPLTIIIFLIYLFATSFQLTIVVLILLPISGYIIGRLGKNLRKSSLAGQQKLGLLLSLVEETLSGLRIIKAFNAQEKVKRRFQKQNNLYTQIMIKMNRRRYLASPLSEFLGGIVVVIVMWYGGSLVLNSNSLLTPQVFITYILIFSQIINPAKSLSTAYYNIQKGLASIDRINKIIKAKDTITEIKKPVQIKSFNQSIEYRKVSFKYENEYVLKDINLIIEKGKTIALVGQSGSGKSTLVDLLPRFYDVSEGEIKIDGHNIKSLKVNHLRELMGNVNQDSILFNDTIFNNIAFGVHNISREEVEAAAKVANAHEFILHTENGYQTNIGDRGNKLSGGQRQRISIARAVLKNPPILILDEATSSLDTESEQLVQQALNNLMKNRTSIVIAHRLSTVRDVDEICVLHEGKIVERGSHNELMKINGYYKKLIDLQMFK